MCIKKQKLVLLCKNKVAVLLSSSLTDNYVAGLNLKYTEQKEQSRYYANVLNGCYFVIMLREKDAWPWNRSDVPQMPTVCRFSAEHRCTQRAKSYGGRAVPLCSSWSPL